MNDAHRAATQSGPARSRFISTYGFAVASGDALARVAARSPAGVLDVGAGTGAWSRLLSDVGVSVVAIDPAPAPSSSNRWFAGSQSWFPIEIADHREVTRHADRTMLISWPTRDAVWPYEALDLYHEAGGSLVAYVGEPPTGRTGDDVFHRLLGELRHCRQCDDRNADAPCVCRFDPLWRLDEVVVIPQLPGHHDQLRFYRRRRTRKAVRRR